MSCSSSLAHILLCALTNLPLCVLGFIQVDENMRRAQQRDAVNQAKFYFRREIFTPTSSRATSGATTPDLPRPDPCGVPPSTNGTTKGFDNNHSNGRPKQRMMENCFPPLPLPDEGLVGGSVKEEYGEYTMDEIINGRVSNRHLTPLDMQEEIRFLASTITADRRYACLLYFLGAGRRVPGTDRPS